MDYPPIETLIPHRLPARVVEAVLERVADLITCRGRISPDHPLAHAGKVPAHVGLEMGAQAAAALAVLLARDEDPSFRTGMGYLVGIRGARFNVLALRTDRDHRVVVRRSGSAGPLALFEIEIYGKSSGCLVTGQISAYALGEAESLHTSRKQNH
jgi:predicted hotdog family 3-hydroxylacyl-ACP dehydratase